MLSLSIIDFSLRASLNVSQTFWYIVFSFSFNLRNFFKLPFWLILDPVMTYSCLLIIYLYTFCNFYYYWYPTLFHVARHNTGYDLNVPVFIELWLLFDYVVDKFNIILGIKCI